MGMRHENSELRAKWSAPKLKKIAAQLAQGGPRPGPDGANGGRS